MFYFTDNAVQVLIAFIKTESWGVQQQQKMSDSETEDSTSTRINNEEFDFSEDYNIVNAQVGAYQDKPLALPGLKMMGRRITVMLGIQISYHLQCLLEA